MTPVCVAMSGAGAKGEGIVAAVEHIASKHEIVAAGGSSFGGLVAIALGCGLRPSEISSINARMLSGKGLLDVGMPWDMGIDGVRTGIYRGRNIAHAIKRAVGERTRLRDLKNHTRIAVADLWARKIVVLDSKKHGDVLAWRAARATMAVEGIFDSIRVRENNARTYADPGIALNVPAGLWDDRPERTVSIRYREHQEPYSLEELIKSGGGDSDLDSVKPVRSISDIPGAMLDLFMRGSAVSLPSYKSGTVDVVIHDDSDSLRFERNPEELKAARSAGLEATKDALAFAGL